MFTDTFGDCCKLLGIHFGHDRAKNDSGVVFLAQDVNRLYDRLHVCNGWSSDCVGSRDGGLVCLINLVCLETTQTELEGWLSSPQPLNSTGREVKARGTV